MGRIITDDEFAEQLLKDMDNLKYGLKYYIDKSKHLENELKYFQNAYENRINESLEKERKIKHD